MSLKMIYVIVKEYVTDIQLESRLLDLRMLFNDREGKSFNSRKVNSWINCLLVFFANRSLIFIFISLVSLEFLIH